MSKSIFDGLDYLYAEMLKGKRVTMTVKNVTQMEIIGDGGRKAQGYEVAFEETPKKFAFAGATVRRQLAMACGTDDPEKMSGKKITLYPVKSARSVSGQAIRIAIPEQVA